MIEVWASTCPPTRLPTPLPALPWATMRSTALNPTLCWKSPVGPGPPCPSLNPTSRTWSWASLSSFPLYIPVAHSLPLPHLPHGWTHPTCPPHPLPPTPPLSARFLPAVPSRLPLCLPSPPPLTPSTLLILMRCALPRPPTLTHIRTSAQLPTPTMMAGRTRELCWRQNMWERGMPRSRSAPWNLPALHLCTILHLKKVSGSFFSSFYANMKWLSQQESVQYLCMRVTLWFVTLVIPCHWDSLNSWAMHYLFWSSSDITLRTWAWFVTSQILLVQYSWNAGALRLDFLQ